MKAIPDYLRLLLVDVDIEGGTTLHHQPCCFGLHDIYYSVIDFIKKPVSGDRLEYSLEKMRLHKQLDHSTNGKNKSLFLKKHMFIV